MQNLAISKLTYADILKGARGNSLPKLVPKRAIFEHRKKYNYIPFWYQKKFLNKTCKIKNCKLHTDRLLLNKDICIKAGEMKYNRLKAQHTDILQNGIGSSKITFENIWKKELIRFITELKMCCHIFPGLRFCIFGGIINKLLNPSFTLDHYDIDIFFTDYSQSSRNNCISPERVIQLFNYFSSNKVLDNLIDTQTLKNDFIEYSTLIQMRPYTRLINRPGLKNLKHYKAKRYFKQIGYIDIDIITGYPNTIGVDCNISNLYYDPYKEEIKQLKPSTNLLETLINIRHKQATLILPTELVGQDNVNQYILLQSRQRKYLKQEWKLTNTFKFPEPEHGWECAICYERNYKTNSSENTITFECNHSYCKSCIIEMTNSVNCPSKNNCPLCRKIIKTKIILV